jgi:hypothetical protein
MCLSPEADLLAAAVTGVVAVDTWRRNHNPDAVLLAAIPAIFTVHNVASAFMWWGLLGKVGCAAAGPATWLYEFVAFVLWPLYVPVAVQRMESSNWRRKSISFVWLLGSTNALWHLFRLVSGQIQAVAHHHYISFVFPPDPTIVGSFYLLATCAVAMLSSHHELILWGAVNALAVAGITIAAANGLPSIWCWWAAVTSVYLNVFIRRHSRRYLSRQSLIH